MSQNGSRFPQGFAEMRAIFFAYKKVVMYCRASVALSGVH